MHEFVKQNEILQPLNESFDEFPKTFYAVLISSLAIISLLIVHLLEIERNTVRNKLETQALKIEKELTTLLKHTSAINNNINWHISKDPYNKKHIYDVLKYHNVQDRSLLSWTLFSWVNSHYKLTVDSEYGILKESLDLSGRDYLPLTEQTPNKLRLGRPVTGSTSNEWMIPSGNGLTDSNGKYLGAIVIGFGIDYLAQILCAELDDNLEFVLFDENFSAILYGNKTSYGPLDGNIENDEETKTLFQNFRSNQQDKIFQTSLFRENKGFLIKKIEKIHYYLAIKYKNPDKRLTLQTLTSNFNEISIIIIILLILLIFTYKREQMQKHKIDFLRVILREHGIVNDNSLTRSKKPIR